MLALCIIKRRLQLDSQQALYREDLITRSHTSDTNQGNKLENWFSKFASFTQALNFSLCQILEVG